ncbi:hypothetical protein EPUL_004450, partial [Erysiphe pulchra]
MGFKYEGIIGKKKLNFMKDGVIIINTARGKVIDDNSLVEAFQSGKFFNADLDVFENEPQIHRALISNPTKKMELLVVKKIEIALDTCHTGSIATSAITKDSA